MTRSILCLTLVFAVSGFARADDAANKRAAKELEGEYEIKAMVIRGAEAPAELVKQIKGVSIKDGEMVIQLPNKEDKATFKVDAAKKPAQIDLTSGTGEARPGLYKVEGGQLVIVFSSGGDRPTDFDAKGEKAAKMVLAKKK